MTHSGQRAPFAGVPTPKNESIRGHVLDDLRDSLAIVAFWIFDLLANLSRSFSFPDHRCSGRRQLPVGGARGHVTTRHILLLMAASTLLPIQTLAIRSPSYILRVDMAVITLPWIVSGRMAVQTTWVFEHGNDGNEQFASPCVIPIIRVSRRLRGGWPGDNTEGNYEDDGDQKF